MKRILFCSLALAVALAGCGRLSEKFGRQSGGYTKVSFNSNRPAGGPSLLYTPQSGGMMIYFARNSAGDGGGFALGFPTDSAAAGASVSIPNGSYQVYAIGFDGSSLSGQVRCGLGNSGATVNLVGGSASVNISLTTTGCNFGSTGSFSDPNGGNLNSDNFDEITIQLCTNSIPTCSPLATGSRWVQVRMLGGEKLEGTGGALNVVPGYTLTGPCTSFASGTAATVRIPSGRSSGGGINAPMDVSFFSDSGCTTLEKRYSYHKGIYDFLGAAANPAQLTTPGGSDTTTFSIFKDF